MFLILSLVPTSGRHSTAPSQKATPDLTVYVHGPQRINSTFWDLYFSAIISQNFFHLGAWHIGPAIGSRPIEHVGFVAEPWEKTLFSESVHNKRNGTGSPLRLSPQYLRLTPFVLFLLIFHLHLYSVI